MRTREKIRNFCLASSKVFETETKPTLPILQDIYGSLLDLSYYSLAEDKKNIRGDISNWGKDFKTATKEAKEKIKNVDAIFLPWIRERTAIEQDARIKFNNNRIELAGYDLKKTHRFNISALIFGFLVFLLGITFSAFLIYNNLSTEGTIFGGSIMLAAVIAFVRVAKK